MTKHRDSHSLCNHDPLKWPCIWSVLFRYIVMYIVIHDLDLLKWPFFGCCYSLHDLDLWSDLVFDRWWSVGVPRETGCRDTVIRLQETLTIQIGTISSMWLFHNLPSYFGIKVMSFLIKQKKNDAHNVYLCHACNQRNSSDCAKTLYYCKIFRLCEPGLKDRKHPRIPLTVIFAAMI